MDRNEINRHLRMIRTANRGLMAFFAHADEMSPSARKAAATLYRKSQANTNAVTLGALKTIANNILQAAPQLLRDSAKLQKEGKSSHTTKGFYTFGEGCEGERVGDGAVQAATYFCELYGKLRDAEKAESQAVKDAEAIGVELVPATK
jgi:hypothetical protein